VGAEVLAQVDGLGAALPGRADRLPHRVPPPDKQPGAALAQLAIERRQAIEEMGDPVRGAAAATEQGLVEDEERDYTLRLAGGSGERRLVADAQVAGEED